MTTLPPRSPTELCQLCGGGDKRLTALGNASQAGVTHKAKHHAIPEDRGGMIHHQVAVDRTNDERPSVLKTCYFDRVRQKKARTKLGFCLTKQALVVLELSLARESAGVLFVYKQGARKRRRFWGGVN
uniref:(northern house mosquito) hypothetical protein n=1 Tax=Culex pipiens TaxID=7175 RepID=A0A8D8F1J9_CULPI